MIPDAKLGNFSVIRNDFYFEEEPIKASSINSITPKVVLWLKEDNESQAVGILKRIAAVAFAILLAVSLIGLPFLIEGIYIWSKHAVSKIEIESDDITENYMEMAFDSYEVEENAKAPEQLKIKEIATDDEEYVVPNIPKEKINLEDVSSSSLSESSMDEDDDLYGPNVNQEKMFSLLAGKCAQTYVSESKAHTPVTINSSSDNSIDTEEYSSEDDLVKNAYTGKVESESDEAEGETDVPKFLSSGWQGHSIQHYSPQQIGNESYGLGFPKNKFEKLNQKAAGMSGTLDSLSLKNEFPNLPVGLKTLDLSGCTSLTELPKELAQFNLSGSPSSKSFGALSSSLKDDYLKQQIVDLTLKNYSWQLKKDEKAMPNTSDEIDQVLKVKSQVNYPVTYPQTSSWMGKTVTHTPSKNTMSAQDSNINKFATGLFSSMYS